MNNVRPPRRNFVNMEDSVLHNLEDKSQDTVQIPTEFENKKELRQKDKPKKKKKCSKLFIIAGVISLMFIIGAIVAVVLLTNKDAEDNTSEKLIFTRTFKKGLQETYAVTSRSNLTLGVTEEQSTRESVNNYTLTVTTVDIIGKEVVLNFILFPGNSTLDIDFNDQQADSNQTDQNNTETLTSEDIENAFAFLNLQIITCHIYMTGKINYCLKPSYLKTEDYDFMVTLVDQLSPVLEAKYFEKDRLLQESDSASNNSTNTTNENNYIEGRQFAFASNNDSTVSIKNSYDMTSSNDSNGTNQTKQFGMGTQTVLDSTTGQILNSEQGGQINVGASEDNENEIVKVFKMDYVTSLALKDSQPAKKEVLEFFDKAIKQIKFMNISNPLETRPSLENSNDTVSGNNTYSEDLNATNETGLEIYNGTEGNGRMLIYGKVVLQGRHEFFRKTVLGGDITSSVRLDCYDSDRCAAKIDANFFGFGIDLFNQEFDFPVNRYTLLYKFIKVKVLNAIKDLSSGVSSDVKAITNTVSHFNQIIGDTASKILVPIQDAGIQIKKVIGEFSADFSKLIALEQPLFQIFDGSIKAMIYFIDNHLVDITKDMFFYMKSIKKMYTYLDDKLKANNIDEETCIIVAQFFGNFAKNFGDYYEEQKQQLGIYNTSLSNYKNRVLPKVDSILQNAANDVQFTNVTLSLLVSSYYKDKITLWSNQILSNFSIYYQNALIRTSMEYMKYQDELQKLQDNLKTLLESRKSGQEETDSNVLSEVKATFTDDNLDELFLTSLAGYDFTQEAMNNIQSTLLKAGKDFLSLLSKFIVYSKDGFHKNVASSLTQTKQTITQSFESINLDLVKSLDEAFVKIVKNFGGLYSTAKRMTDKDYSPSDQEMRKDQDVINIQAEISDLEGTFRNLLNIKTDVQKLQTIPGPDASIDKVVRSSGTSIDGLSSDCSSLQQYFNKIKDTFKFDLGGVTFDTNSLKNIVQTTGDLIKSRTSLSLSTSLQGKSRSFSDNEMSKALSIKSLLLTRLDILLPRSKISDIKALQYRKELKYCVPVSVISICLRGYFQAFLNVGIEFGLSNGALQFQVMPYGQAEVGLDGFASIILIEAGGYVKGILFQGRVPMLVSFDYLRSMRITFTIEIYLTPFIFEAGVYIEFFYPSFKICKVKIWFVTLYLPCPYLASKRVVIWSFRTSSQTIYKKILDKTLQLK